MPSDSTIKKFLNKAKEASKLSTYSKQHLGSILVYGNKILAIGYNTNKTNPLQFKYNKYRKFKNYYSPNSGSVHAEGLILLKTRYLDIDWSKTTLYIYREYKKGGVALAKPCPGCLVALLERQIGMVIFTIPGGYEVWTLKGDYYEVIKQTQEFQ